MIRLSMYLVLLAGCDGSIGVKGLIVDDSGKPIAGARVSGEGRTVESNESGCFDFFKVTGPFRRTFPIVVRAQGFSDSSGDVPAPGSTWIRVQLTKVGSARRSIETSPPPHALCHCGPPSR